MLSEALQRNAKHEARLSNISGCSCVERSGPNQRFFATLRMTSDVAKRREAVFHSRRATIVKSVCAFPR